MSQAKLGFVPKIQIDPGSESQDRPDSTPETIHDPLRLVHHHPGYLRIQAGSFIQSTEDNSTATAVQTTVESVPGFRSWRHNPKTGSVVVEYDPGTVDADDLLKYIAKSAGLRSIENATSHRRNRETLINALLDTVQDLNHVVSEMTGDRGDLREVVPTALALTSVVSFVLHENRGRLPRWDGALYHSYRIFMQWHRRETRTRERVGRQKEEGDAQ